MIKLKLVVITYYNTKVNTIVGHLGVRHRLKEMVESKKRPQIKYLLWGFTLSSNILRHRKLLIEGYFDDIIISKIIELLSSLLQTIG